ncbi:MAG TPA: trehalose-6-phosphate synthase [Acidimicrobiia bacterium]|nr:trehalose-6-phosphate synthase [Acidimicrobiia bacterium]
MLRDDDQHEPENRNGESTGLVVVSNRLPVRFEPDGDAPGWHSSPGGLVSALTPVLQRRGGVWVGGAEQCGEVTVPESYEGISLQAVPISADEHDDFYVGFANRTLWPLYHDAVRAPSFERRWWQAYVAVNHRYAEAAAGSARPGATVWVHDYHLQLVPMMLRALRPDVRIGFFLHTPFPPQELYMQIPWRRELIEGLLGADLVGFQVPGAATNFARLARQLTAAGGDDDRLKYDGRVVRVGAFPISIDTSEIIRRATRPHVIERAEQLRTDLGDPDFVMLGVDRLDYTKGLQQRVKAVAELFAEGTLSTPRHVMIQVAVPSRGEDTHYKQEREDLERLIGEVNGMYSDVGHAAIHYLHQSVDLDELIALYLAADVMLVTPLRDGMNLVAKEYVASKIDESGALILSEFAGAARELDEAILVNPHDLDGIKGAIRDVLDLDPNEARARMRYLRGVVGRRDVHAWARDFLATLSQTDGVPARGFESVA